MGLRASAERSSTRGDADLAALGAVLADRARVRILLALGDGRALPASVLAAEAGVAASTASSHLARLVDAGLLVATARGRYRYYRLAGPAVGELIETLARLCPTAPVRSLREGTRAHAVRRARSCYDHLAGRLGVDLTAALLAGGLLTVAEQAEPDGRPGPASRPGELTPAGRTRLTALGLALPDADVVRCCTDWTEQRPHLAGPHGRALLFWLFEREWLRRAPQGRAVRVTDAGRRGLRTEFGVEAG
jgi:DNA-binding transcriptional ArsR family regulator